MSSSIARKAQRKQAVATRKVKQKQRRAAELEREREREARRAEEAARPRKPGQPSGAIRKVAAMGLAAALLGGGGR